MFSAEGTKRHTNFAHKYILTASPLENFVTTHDKSVEALGIFLTSNSSRTIKDMTLFQTRDHVKLLGRYSSIWKLF